MQIVIEGRILNYLEVNPKGKIDLIVLHGWAHNSGLWQNLAKKLSPNIHCLLLDLPAFGASQPLLGNPNVPEYTQTIVDFINKLDLKKPILLGHSFGGQIALDLAAKQPQLISQIILVSPAGIRQIRPKLSSRLAHIIKIFTKKLPKNIQNWLITRVASNDYGQANKAQRIVLSNIVRYDLTAKLTEINVPTHLIWGSEDHEIPYAGKLIAQAIPDCRLTILYGAGHNPHLTHTDKLAQLINTILNVKS